MASTQNINTKSSRLPFSFDYHSTGLEENQIARLEQCREAISNLGRRTTDQAFDLGAQLSDVSELVPERTFGKWVKACCGFSDRSARNYVAVHKKLETYRERLTEIGAAPTVLFELTKATPAQIDQALNIAAASGHLQVKDVKKIVQIERPEQPKPQFDPFEIGGIDGLNSLMQIKTRNGLKSFEKHVAEIISEIEDSLKENAKGKRIGKDSLFECIKTEARYADAELCNLALAVAPNPAVPVRIEQGRHFPKTSEWETVRQMLEQLSVKERWPAATELAQWFPNKVLPVLCWAIAKSNPGTLELKQMPKTLVGTGSASRGIETIAKTKPHISNDIQAFEAALDMAFTQVSKAADIHTN
ncbi:hypothetical protein IPU75_19710 [Ochrobactrum sp. SD129]|nr:hypothetical protein [Ochrobactrum sp. SD129]